jgi:hypothetical protein
MKSPGDGQHRSAEAPHIEAGNYRWWEGFLCGCVVVAAICASRPYAEMGFIDDWSYTKTAFEYARTGHFVYNGWATAMLGWQVPWGGLFIKLFGYSFTAVRCSMLPVALFSVWLFYAALARLGITRANAAFGALAFGLSPLFVPLAASYMTDVSGVFVILLCLYMSLRALGASSTRNAQLWIIAAATTNVVGGTVRQIAWLGALVMVPSTVWLLRRKPGIAVTGILLWFLSGAGIFAFFRWWQRQPFSVPERIFQGLVTAAMAGHLSAEVLKAFLCLLLLLSPILVAWTPQIRTFNRTRLLGLAAVLVVLAAGAWFLYSRGTLEFRVMPWIGHVIGTESIFPSTGEMLGKRPVTLNYFSRTVISLAMIGAALIWLMAVWPDREIRRPADGSRAAMSPGTALVLLLPFTMCYIALLLPRALYSFLYDRYLLGILPVAIALLLIMYERRFAKALPWSSAAVLGIFGVYTVAATHDWFALNRARVRAVNEVHEHGIPFTQIQGGFEFDGWTEIQTADFINYGQFSKREQDARPSAPENDLAPPCRLNFAQFTPHVVPQYFVVFHPMPCLADSDLKSVDYHTWLPPFTRAIYIQRRPAAAYGKR